jgi:MYXO-CTERM domain-containing protein
MTSLLLIVASQAATLTVGPTQPYTTINAAVAAAADGDTVRVEAGTYAEDLDLRGRSLTVISEDGPAVTTLSPTNTIRLDNGAFEGFTVSPAPATAITIASGAPTVREIYVEAPSSIGVAISGGSPLIEEVGVWNAGLHAFVVTGGSPTLQRDVSYLAAKNGFYLKSASTVRNDISIGGMWGFVFENEASTATNLVGVGASSGGVAALFTSTISNSAFRDNLVALKCFNSAVPVFPNGMAWLNATANNCTGSPLAAVRVADPSFSSWNASYPFEQLDLRPTGTSPMLDAGTGLDTDGTTADLGAFGGSEADWRDRDGDGYPVVFDCDDHQADSYVYAPERADGRDNDCDGLVDEDIPVDTGGDDTGGGDSGDTADSGDTDTDTGNASGTDLDGDGWPASVDCDEHNLATYPGAPERMDGADNDCDEMIDEGTAAGDDDGDGFSELGGDCDDTRADRNPSAVDDQNDGVDNDCDGLDDSARGADLDGDDHFDSVDDCDDTDPLANVDALDPTDGVDNDCDGLADDTMLNADGDGDGQTPSQGDCEDDNPGVFFGNTDIPDDFRDQDCNGTDNYDADRDGDPSPASGGTDCDDTRSTVYLGAPELCDDNADNDCDGTYDEDCDGGAAVTEDPGCGCATADPGTSTLGLAALALALVRRRRPRAGSATDLGPDRADIS